MIGLKRSFAFDSCLAPLLVRICFPAALSICSFGLVKLWWIDQGLWVPVQAVAQRDRVVEALPADIDFGHHWHALSLNTPRQARTAAPSPGTRVDKWVKVQRCVDVFCMRLHLQYYPRTQTVSRALTCKCDVNVCSKFIKRWVQPVCVCGWLSSAVHHFMNMNDLRRITF